MSTQPVTDPLASLLVLGDPRLRRVSRPVADVTAPDLVRGRQMAHAALASFRDRHGFGRAIAAPQLGDARRYIAANLGDGPFTLHNPRITWRSAQRFTLWDDCMSFPDLLVRVARHCSITVEFEDDTGATRGLRRLPPRLAELFQHEIDHLDGVLAVDLALDNESLVMRRAFEALPGHFQAMVDTPADAGPDSPPGPLPRAD